MKTGIAFFALLLVGGSAIAQEYDDMYFTSKDRAKISASRSPQVTNTTRSEDNSELVQSKINPTDSYSGRGVNPEYTSQSKFNSTNTEEDPQYFVSSYIPANVNSNLNRYNQQGSFYAPYYGNNYSNCNCGTSSFYNNPYYGYGGMSGFGSPYSSFYGNGFNSGWSSMLGYAWGGMGSGMFGSMGYGYGNMWGSPSSMFWNNYYGMNNYYGGYYSPFNNYYGYNSYYPRSVVIINDNITTSHRRRAERSSTGNNYVNTNSRTNSDGTYTRNGRMISSTGNTGGRTQSTTDSSPYYNRSWRNNSSQGTTNSGRSSFWSNGSSGTSRGSWSNGNGNNSNWSSPSRSSWSNSSFGGGSRSGGSFGGGGGSRSSGGGGGHSRGGRGN